MPSEPSPPSPAAGGAPPALVVTDPVTGAEVTRVATCDSAGVALAVGRARAAQPAWAAVGFGARREQITRLRSVVVERMDELVTLVCRETGRPPLDAVAVELSYILEAMRYWGKHARRFLAPRRVPLGLMALKSGRLRYQPHPVVAIVAPWNFPLILTLGEAIPPLMAGCAVIIKPAPLTAATGDIIRILAAAAGFPADVLQVVHGDAEVGEALVDGCDYVAFTGSVETGKRVLARAALTLTPVSAELGGKDAMVVLDDADLDRAAAGAVWGAFFNSGQVCESVERLYVQRAVAPRLVAEIVRRTNALRQGGPGEGVHDIGAMTSPGQLQVVEEHVRDAVERGASLLAGGHRAERPGLFFEPTVLTGVDHDMLVMRDETFGPVLPVMVFDSDDDAVRLANDSRYGLSASVWSRDPRRAAAVAARLEAGAVHINDCLSSYFAPELPFGGVKESGYARRHGGAEGIRKFCWTKTLFRDRLGLRAEPYWYPAHPSATRYAKKLLRLLYGVGLGARLRDLFR